VISTPVGIEIGVRPSFDCGCRVVEKLRCAMPCQAGTRNPGRVTAEDEAIARSNALPWLGDSIVTADWSCRKTWGGLSGFPVQKHHEGASVESELFACLVIGAREVIARVWTLLRTVEQTETTLSALRCQGFEEGPSKYCQKITIN
jgi:hypothetical protein